jgi:hypothetical protein
MNEDRSQNCAVLGNKNNIVNIYLDAAAHMEYLQEPKY